MKLSIDFNLILTPKIPGVPEPILYEKMSAPPHTAPPSAGVEPEKIPQSVSIWEKNGTWSGVYTHPQWGENPVRDLFYNGKSLSFTALSGKDDKGGEPVYFSFVIALNPATGSVLGCASGLPPFFRSFLLLEGKIAEMVS